MTLQSSEEMLTSSVSSRINVIKEVVGLTDADKSVSLRLSSHDGTTPPDLCVRSKGRDIARVKFDANRDGANRCDASIYVSHVMKYLEADGAKAVDLEVALRALQDSERGAEAMLQQEAREQEIFNREMANRMRLLCKAKRDRHCAR